MEAEIMLSIIVRAMSIVIIILGLIVSIKHNYIGRKMFEFQQKHITEKYHKLETLIIGIFFIILGVAMLLFVR